MKVYGPFIDNFSALGQPWPSDSGLLAVTREFFHAVDCFPIEVVSSVILENPFILIHFLSPEILINVFSVSNFD